MKCITCNNLLLGSKAIEAHQEEHVVMTLDEAADFLRNVNKLGLITSDMRHHIMNGGRTPWPYWEGK
jgi:hypothetical protein